MLKELLSLATLLLWLSCSAVSPETGYTPVQCEGSSMPYLTPPANSSTYPDSLTPVFINHVGRHGARFMSSSKFTDALMKSLDKAEMAGCITPEGIDLKNLCLTVIKHTDNRWGALDSLGQAEQQEIATRTFHAFPNLFIGQKIHAISSYIPRCIASMDAFTHQLAKLDNKIEIYSTSGKQNSPLMRPWENDTIYQNFIESGSWNDVYKKYRETVVPASVASRILGKNYQFTKHEAKDFTLNLYKLISGCAAIGIDSDWNKYMTLEEYNALWSIENLHHYLTHSASTISYIPAELATNLLKELISTTQEAVDCKNSYTARFRFGHAETLMPLLALMHINGCYYLTDDFKTVGEYWKDFHVVPMAANIRIILFKATSGRHYIRVDHNEIPVPLLPDDASIYVPWEKAKKFLQGLIPQEN